MLGDTTVRNRAHQAFGSRMAGVLAFVKLLPWLLLGGAIVLAFGAERTASAIGDAGVWVTAERPRGIAALVLAAAGLFWLKRRWRRGDYRP